MVATQSNLPTIPFQPASILHFLLLGGMGACAREGRENTSVITRHSICCRRLSVLLLSLVPYARTAVASSSRFIYTEWSEATYRTKCPEKASKNI